MGIYESKTYRRWFERGWVIDAISVVPSLIAASVGAWNNLRDPSPDTQLLGRILAFSVIWLLIASVLKVLHAYRKDQSGSDSHHDLQTALAVLHAIVAGQCRFTAQDQGRLRMTILRVVPPTARDRPVEELEQIVPYVGGLGRGSGRRFSVRSGIAGRAVREQAAFAASRQHDDYAEFLRELVTVWGYTSVDARQLTEDRYSWMAVPLMGPHSVVAVVYLDSDRRHFFTDDVQALIIDGCHGMEHVLDATFETSE